MSKANKDKHLRTSILDRLMDEDPHSEQESELSRVRKLKDLRSSVRRDLEYLLNTRCRVVSPPEEFFQLHTSVLNFGLPDLATVNILNVEKKKEFTENIENVIRTFEPRFKSVRVKYLDATDKTDRTVRFRIDAVLYADPAPEIVVFDSILEPVLRTVKVEESHHG